MANKTRGTNAERELLHMFWAQGWVACRAAGSGSMRYPSPDLFVSKSGKHLAIECKITKEKSKYLKKEEIHSLQEYAQIAGVEAYIAIKFPREQWLFVKPNQLREQRESYSVTLNEAKENGKQLNQL
ncbi:Holliday junction resolvase [Candidatus Woesearchaeota archaeon]|nr:Holliday junction resolvase [Candidatus Woesearchaeota archaeon]